MANPFDSLPFVSAGFPSPGERHRERMLDFNELLRRNPSSTETRRVVGNSMEGAFIPHGSIVVYDCSIKPPNNGIVVGNHLGEIIIKHIVRTPDGHWLFPANDNYEPVRLENDNEFQVWGTATHAIIELHKPISNYYR